LRQIVLSSNHHLAGAVPTRFARVGKIAPAVASSLPHISKRFSPPYALPDDKD
jgi:hypothetical protein